MKKFVFAACLAGLAAFAQAGEDDVRKALEARVGKVEKLHKAPMPGLWEASVDGQIFYVDDKAAYLIVGNLMELNSGRNLTAERQNEASRSLLMNSLNLAIKQVRGNGKNILITFEDPNCGYCRKLAKDLVKAKDVTIYTFLYPVLGDDSYDKSKAIWCAADKGKAWNDWMVNNTGLGTPSAKCDLSGLEKSAALGRRLRINGTPALFFANGERVGGYIPLSEIEKRY